MKVIELFALSFALAGCSLGDPASPSHGSTPVDAQPIEPASAGPGGIAQNVAELFQTRVLPTCALNGGVCHNSNTYPDLRHLAALEELVQLPCGRNTDVNYPDVCEPPGDRIFAPGVDVEIARVTFDAASLTATLVTAADVSASAQRISSVRIRRMLPSGAWFFPAPADGIELERTSARTFTLRLDGAKQETLAFFEPALPLREDRVWPADLNGNGVAGAEMGWREIVPGKPENSYLVARLWDTTGGLELMPRQCRTWNDAATRALGCWIQGLRADEHGKVTNFYDDIDYARCTFVVPSAGRCGN